MTAAPTKGPDLLILHFLLLTSLMNYFNQLMKFEHVTYMAAGGQSADQYQGRWRRRDVRLVGGGKLCAFLCVVCVVFFLKCFYRLLRAKLCPFFGEGSLWGKLCPFFNEWFLLGKTMPIFGEGSLWGKITSFFQ